MGCGSIYSKAVPASVLVLSLDPALYANVRATLQSDGRFVSTDQEIHCSPPLAPLTNIYPAALPAEEWDGWAAQRSPMPDPRSMSVLILECRDAHWVAEIGALLDRGLAATVWFVDARDRAWSAGDVDAVQLALTRRSGFAFSGERGRSPLATTYVTPPRSAHLATTAR
ncbi:hypothetical protein GCM10028777_02620 [Angustibacter speluncae]